MTTGAPGPTAERLPPDLEPVHAAHLETWWFATWDVEGAAWWISISAHPATRRSWYAAAWVEPGARPVVVADAEMPWPRPERYLEIRGRGLWAHHVCEEPLQRWSIGLEAVAVAHDDPAQGLDDGWGDPDGLAGDVEWEGVGDVVERSDGSYDQPCRVDGVLERVGRELRPDDAPGHRGRIIGGVEEPALIVAGRLAGRPVAATAAAPWSAVELPRHATVELDGTQVSASATAHAAWRWPDGSVHAVAPVTLTAADGRTGTGLARWRATAGGSAA
ncbi:MAG: hypothetical protein AAFZ07_20400 [Actinomycetota bacterium]